MPIEYNLHIATNWYNKLSRYFFIRVLIINNVHYNTYFKTTIMRTWVFHDSHNLCKKDTVIGFPCGCCQFIPCVFGHSGTLHKPLHTLYSCVNPLEKQSYGKGPCLQKDSMGLGSKMSDPYLSSSSRRPPQLHNPQNPLQTKTDVLKFKGDKNAFCVQI